MIHVQIKIHKVYISQSSIYGVKVKSSKRANFSLQVAMEMPFDIRSITSPTHTIKYKVSVVEPQISNA